MGRVHVETLGQNRGCHEYEVFNLSEIKIIEALIKHRHEIDKFHEVKFFSESNDVELSNGVPIFHELIEDIYLDLENLIKQTNLLDNQREVVDLLMLGYIEEDIAELLGKNVSTIKQMFSVACKRLKEQNDRNWEEWVETSGYIKAKGNYKYCKKCKSWHKANDKNFGVDKRNKDGLKSYCKRCESYTKKTP
jgi:hypothetical protein